MDLVVEKSYAMDDSCQFQCWARGHWPWGEFVTAVQDLIALEERDIPNWVVIQAPMKQRYQRAVPCRDSIVGDIRYVPSDQPGRGATAVTIMDFWFPLHAYKKSSQAQQQFSEDRT
jgi:hypothetical protein